MYKLDKKELEYRLKMRGKYPEGQRWYAAMAHIGREKHVLNFIQDELTDQGVGDAFLPIVEPGVLTPYLEAGARSRFLFRSYLFLQCAMTDSIYSAICEHPSVFQILGRAYRIPSDLDDGEVRNLRQILRAECNPELVSRSHIGEEAEIVAGLMAGIRGRVLYVSAKEVKLEVSFSFFNGQNAVAVVVPRVCVRIMTGSHQNNRVGELCYA
ncbi:MAG: hypothetical protein NTX50_31145 [Candidatus Sumerlaeota bacterium]|nr:hypothetical protein [Candidatus Sumerlaeota bacterium]